MVKELKEVISKVEQLEDEEQKQIAKLIEDEIKWDTTFQRSPKQLGNLAEEALAEYKAGKTKNEDW